MATKNMANKYDMADAQFVGNMTINPGETVIVTDPCYNADVWCRMNGLKVCSGNYTALAQLHKEPYDFGDIKGEWTHIKSLGIYLNGFVCNSDNMEKIGEIGVDAGRCGIFTKKPDYTDEQWQEFCDLIGHLDHKMLDNELGTYGVVSCSGYGDGGYPVFAHKNTDGEVDGLMVVFIDDED